MMVFSVSLDDLTSMIRVLQQQQRLLPMTATLADVAALLAEMRDNADAESVLAEAQAAYGSECLLENAIQTMVGEHIAVQLQQRTAGQMREAA